MSAYNSLIKTTVAALSANDGVVIVPTDTTYGIICRLDFPLAITRIYSLKSRDRNKPLIILGANVESLFQWAQVDKTNLKLARFLASRFWPGPLTIVVSANTNVPRDILAGGATVGLRMPKHKATLRVISHLPNSSAASTSANISGGKPPTSIDEVLQSLGSKVNYILPDCNEKPAGTESSIVDLSEVEPKILRVGALSADVIFSAIHEFR